MATINLTTGADTYTFANQSMGGFNGTTTKVNGNLIDALNGVAGVIDTLSIIDPNTSGNFKIGANSDGVISITTGSGTTQFKSFEVIKWSNAVTINLGTAANDTITGSSSNDTVLFGLDGNDTINGGLGADIMYGGNGNDTFVVDNAGDLVIELALATSGIDTVQTSLTSYSLVDTDGTALINDGTAAKAAATNGGNIENLTYDNGALADVAFTATGNALNNTITGGTASDTYVLTGASTNYTFTALDATHTQIVDNRGAAGDGTDIVIGIENIKFGAAAAVALSSLLVAPITGTTGADVITGTTGADTMVGLAGDDTYTVDNAGDIVTEALNEGTDTVNASINYTLATNVEKLNLTGTAISGTGNSLNNAITGNASANIIDGGTGADAMTGDAGSDTYYVDNALDTVTEVAGGGTADTVISSISLTLAAEVENLTLATGTAALDGTGNALANTITGNDGNNVLDGGADAVVDTLNGGLGNDTFVLGSGNDTVGDTGGTDTITSTITRSLAGYAVIENLTLLGGTAAIDGTGNALVNIITGNDGNNILDGGADALVDTLNGGLGNDTYVLASGSDTVADTGGIDTITSTISRNLAGYAQIESLTLLGGTVAIDGTGNALANTITGNDGNNVLDGGLDALVDTLNGGLGNDTYVLASGSDTVADTGGIDTITSTITRSLLGFAQIENLTLLGGTVAIDGTGNALANTIIGNNGNNVIDGGTGADAMTGGAGDDTFIVDDAGDTVIETAGGGIDTVNASVNFTLSAEVEKLILSGAAISGTGNALDNTITGNASNNTIDGGAGTGDVFVLTGNRSDYTYTVIDATHTQITDSRVGGDGTDTVTNIETVQFAGGVTYTVDVLRSNIISGTAGVDTLTGSAANDTLDGGLGADAMAGLAGDDIYLVDNVGDTITEVAGEGTADSVQASVDFTLSAEVENLILLTGALAGTGNAAVNTITGNDAANTLNGMGGLDTLVGGNGNDTYVIDNAGVTVTETATGGTADVVNAAINYTLGANIEVLNLTGAALVGTGNADANIMNGNDKNNTLNGKGGADKMSGGLGHDIYYVDVAGDVVTEALNAGTDSVYSLVSYTLAANVENLTLLAGVTALNGTGNALVNTITGNDLANTLNGLGGADKMAGGLGNDTYYADVAGDVVTEALNAGTDTVLSSASTYTLAANVENLTLAAGVAALNGTGNALVNTIIGNSGANILDGNVGADKMTGGLGNDTYLVDNALDVVIEIAGGGTADRVKASASYVLAAAANIEFLETTNAALATVINLAGNALANTITGNAGANIITGGLGHDIMTGGLGRDVFDFDLITETIKGATTRDFITDFTHLTDRVDLSTIDSNTKIAGNQAFTFLAAKGAAFTGVAGQLHHITEGVNTVVEGDVNGDKIADFQIQLNGIKVLTAVDFVL
jgi:Ca2+-binding RTX toxin-like protein